MRLLFTQYIEGSSFNKALEVGNTTGDPVDLDAGDYYVVGYHNGSTAPTYEIELTGTLADGDAWVLADTQAAAALTDVADHTRGGLWNGDDALVLYRDYVPAADTGTVLDSIGQAGVQQVWGTGDTTTQNHTLCPIEGRDEGDTDPFDVYDPADDWVGLPQDTFGGIGDPTACGPDNTPIDGTVFISEFHYDNVGADVGEFVEVTAPAGADLSGWTVLLYNGNGGGVYGTHSLSGTVDDQVAGYGTVVVDTPGLQNGSPDGIALADATGELVEFLSYEGVFTATDGPAEGVESRDVVVTQGSATPIGASIDRVGEVPEAWEWVSTDTNSRGAPNPGSVIDGTEIPALEPEECTPDTMIHDINEVGANGLPSADPAQVGQRVSVEGVVTANFLDGLSGIFVQEEDEDADADPTTSEGIFVFLPGVADDALEVGDLACIAGTVGQFQGTYQLSSAEFEVVDSGVALPTAVDLEMPVDDRVELAQLAGMRVDLTAETGAMTITQNFFLGRFGELDLSADGFLWHPAELHDLDSPEAVQLREDNLSAMIKLDDAHSTTNRSPTPWLANGDVRAGAETTDTIEGITHFQFGSFRIQPTAPDTIEFVNLDNPRPDGPPDVLAGADPASVTATVAAFNVLNYFTTFGSRGADDANEFELQAAKIVTAITTMDADVVGLMEIENNFGTSGDALADLVDRLNAVTSPGTYEAVGLDAPVGTDAISNAMIYQPERVTPVGELALADHPDFVNPLGGASDRNRPAIAQAFEVETGDVFVAVVNHLKSKGSPCTVDGDPGHPIAGNCNLTRTAAAEELTRWLAEDDPTGTGADDIAIIGDLNAYAFEDPIHALRDAGYVDAFADEGRVYTFTFDGEHGRLDHGFLSPALTDNLVGAAIWHINTDEPAAFDYNDWNPPENQDESEFRSSDHDPVMLGLQFARKGSGCRAHRPTHPDLPLDLDRPERSACPA